MSRSPERNPMEGGGLEERVQHKRTLQDPRRERGHPRLNQNDFYELSDMESDQALVYSERRRGQRNQGLRERNRVDDNIKNINMAISPFQGKTDPKAYLEMFTLADQHASLRDGGCLCATNSNKRQLHIQLPKMESNHVHTSLADQLLARFNSTN
ncbi:hypothetical protein J1N35_021895 [Gossypium stocksii]|uniref:Uncharacterized protein n=1 Tax=Gossypium stocksii TaxID=47602 RepID=A0A9D4A2X3_9ROSI|nr:hypothetical protein J1N35_021895 [Gossypium stocksii]